MQNIKVLTIHSNFERGGAAIVATHLHNSFNTQKELGVNSYFLSPNESNSLNNNYINLGVGKASFLSNVLLYRMGFGEGVVNKKKWESFFNKFNIAKNLIHLHNAHGYYLPQSILEKLVTNPLVWTLHDFWLLTGRCASPVNCVGYLDGCNPCPFLNRYPSIWVDESKNMYLEKIKLLSNKNIKFVVPSYFMYEQSIKMGLPKEQVTVIYNPVSFSLEESKKVSRELARKNLCFNYNELIGIFISNKLDDPGKGLLFLLPILEKLKYISNWKFIFVGHCSDKIRKIIHNTLGVRAIITGFISDRVKLGMYLKASNFFVNPTSSESFGLLNVEAALSGCNVIATDLPVIKETIGNLGNYFSVNNDVSLFELLKDQFLSKNEGIDLNNEFIEELSEKFSINNILKKYRLCYEDVINVC